MGGGPVMRSLAALGTLGLSETAQKKPFQDLGNDNPVNSAAGGPLRLLAHVEKLAKKRSLKKLFVLTTQTAQWFTEKGFVHAKLDQLPSKKQRLYNYQRNSKIFIKSI